MSCTKRTSKWLGSIHLKLKLSVHSVLPRIKNLLKRGRGYLDLVVFLCSAFHTDMVAFPTSSDAIFCEILATVVMNLFQCVTGT